jgi:glutamyl-tRNA synthetase
MNSNFSDWRIQNPDKSYTEFELKLENVCKEYVARLSAKEVYDHIFRWAQKYDPELVKRMEENREYCIEILNIEREGDQIRKDIVKWEDVYDQFSIFFDDMYEELERVEFPENVEKEDIKKIIDMFLDTYDMGDSTDVWFGKIKDIGNELGYTSDYKAFKANPEEFKGKVGDVAMVLRIALTKKSRTPDLHQVMRVLGKEKVEERLKNFKLP